MVNYALVILNDRMEDIYGVRWPEEGIMIAPGEDPLKGFLDGEGEVQCMIPMRLATHWVVARIIGPCQNNGNLCSFREGEVMYCGTQLLATDFLRTLVGPKKAIIGSTMIVDGRAMAVVGAHGTAQAGDYGTAQAGDHGTAQAGMYGTARAGMSGTAEAEEYGVAIAVYKGTARVRACGIAIVGDSGTAQAGECGMARAGCYGTACVGDHGTAQAGDYGTAIAGDYGTAYAGNNGVGQAGIHGIIQIRFGSKMERKIVVGYVGRNVKPNVKYRLDSNGEFIEV